jgi:hypothetical protein
MIGAEGVDRDQDYRSLRRFLGKSADGVATHSGGENQTDDWFVPLHWFGSGTILPRWQAARIRRAWMGRANMVVACRPPSL